MARFEDEVREFMQEMRGYMEGLRDAERKKRHVITAYRAMIDRLEKQNTDLMDRVMARDIGELKTFRMPQIEGEEELSYDPMEDEGLAGQIVEMEEDTSGSVG